MRYFVDEFKYLFIRQSYPCSKKFWIKDFELVTKYNSNVRNCAAGVSDFFFIQVEFDLGLGQFALC